MTDTKQMIPNLAIEDIRPGDNVQSNHKLTLHDLELVAALTGSGVAADNGSVVWAGAMIAALAGTRLPGAGCRIDVADLNFHAPLAVGDTLDLVLSARSVDPASHGLVLDCKGTGPNGAPVFSGSLRVTAAAGQVVRTTSELPEIVIEERGAKFRKLIARTETLDPIITAVVHPVEPNAIAGAVDAARAGLITPLFIGPEARIRAAAEEAGIDLSPWQIIDVEHSTAAAETAAQAARDGKAHALMKGSLHTDEFLHPILLPEMNLRTDRRLSHVFLMDVPAYDRLLFITDGAINIAPDLAAKKEIVENAVQVAHALGIETPRVAILSAVEVINPRIPSTLDAAALCKMAERGQIEGAILDGPLAFDNAVSKLAAGIKHIQSAVAGQADILLAPDLDAGNMIAKQLEYLAASEAAGVVSGARVPIVLTSRADSARSRLASCAVAALIHAHRIGGAA